MNGKMARLLDDEDNQIGGTESMKANVPVRRWRKQDRQRYNQEQEDLRQRQAEERSHNQ